MTTEVAMVDPDADAALVDMIQGMDTRQVVEYIATLTAGLHRAKSSATLAQLRMELAINALEPAIVSGSDTDMRQAMVKAVSEMRAVLRNMGWTRKVGG